MFTLEWWRSKQVFTDIQLYFCHEFSYFWSWIYLSFEFFISQEFHQVIKHIVQIDVKSPKLVYEFDRSEITRKRNEFSQLFWMCAAHETQFVQHLFGWMCAIFRYHFLLECLALMLLRFDLVIVFDFNFKSILIKMSFVWFLITSLWNGFPASYVVLLIA